VNKVFENEQMFKRLNEGLTEATSAIAPADFPKDFVMALYCECANKVCQEKVSIAYEEYKKIKDKPLSFVVSPEHYLPQFERLVRQTANYWIVVKRPENLNKPFET
jgi:hypothetical protein